MAQNYAKLYFLPFDGPVVRVSEELHCSTDLRSDVTAIL